MVIYEVSQLNSGDSYDVWDSYGEHYMHKEAAQAAVDRLNEAWMRNLKQWAQADEEVLVLIRAGLRPKRDKPFHHVFRPRTTENYRVDEVQVIE